MSTDHYTNQEEEINNQHEENGEELCEVNGIQTRSRMTTDHNRSHEVCEEENTHEEQYLITDEQSWQANGNQGQTFPMQTAPVTYQDQFYDTQTVNYQEPIYNPQPLAINFLGQLYLPYPPAINFQGQIYYSHQNPPIVNNPEVVYYPQSQPMVTNPEMIAFQQQTQLNLPNQMPIFNYQPQPVLENQGEIYSPIVNSNEELVDHEQPHSSHHISNNERQISNTSPQPFDTYQERDYEQLRPIETIQCNCIACSYFSRKELNNKISRRDVFRYFKKPCFYLTKAEKALIKSSSEFNQPIRRSSVVEFPITSDNQFDVVDDEPFVEPNDSVIECDENTVVPSMNDQSQLDLQIRGNIRKVKILTFDFYKKFYWKLYLAVETRNFKLNDICQYTIEIWKIHKGLQMTEKRFLSNITVCNEIQATLKVLVGNYNILLIGSMLSGLADVSSNIDLTVVCPPTTRREVVPIPMLHAKTILRNFRDKRVRNLSMSDDLNPIIQFTWLKQGQVQVTMRMDFSYGLSTTHLNYLYTQCDWRLQPLYAAVKKWAVSKHLSGFTGAFLSSYSLSLMVIFFLQQGVKPRVLPCLHENDDITLHTGFIRPIDLTDNFGLNWNSNNTLTFGQLFKHFFHYYKEFDFQTKVISVRTSNIITRTPAKGHKVDSFLFIEEPFSRANTISHPSCKLELKKMKTEMELTIRNMRNNLPIFHD